VLSASDYYAFGMEMPGRVFNSSSYRYGFNGKENDREWGVSLIQDYGMRLYNPALCKFLSVDPLYQSYPWNSTYAFAENRVIDCIDLDGGEAQYYTIANEAYKLFFPINAAISNGTGVASEWVYAQKMGYLPIVVPFMQLNALIFTSNVLLSAGSQALGVVSTATANPLATAANAWNSLHGFVVFMDNASEADVKTVVIGILTNPNTYEDIAGAIVLERVTVVATRFIGPPRPPALAAEGAAIAEAGEVASTGGGCFTTETPIKTAIGFVTIGFIATSIQAGAANYYVLAYEPPKDTISYITEIDKEAITPDTWQWVHLTVDKTDGHHSEVSLLRPKHWISEHNIVAAGNTMFLDLPEVGITGTALVVGFSPTDIDTRATDSITVPYETYTYRPVTGVFVHHVSETCRLAFNNDTVNVVNATLNHRFYSADRHTWIPAADLFIGENVLSPNGVVQLTGYTYTPQPTTVYNLEVYRTHTYLVGTMQAVVHNPGPCDLDIAKLAAQDLPSMDRAAIELFIEENMPAISKKGQSPDGSRMHWQDANGKTRIRIDPPDAQTKYDHIHLYDSEGNSLNTNGEIVPYTSEEAHIPITP
jgi:RHS repeat-associated protein